MSGYISDEIIVYILRQTSLSIDDIRHKFTGKQLHELVAELQYQEALDEYDRNYAIASILAAVYNTIPRKSQRTLSPKDFLNCERPTRRGDKQHKVKLDQKAEEIGIIVPEE